MSTVLLIYNFAFVLLITQRIVITPSCLRQRCLLVRLESHTVKVFAAAEGGSKVSSHLLLISDEDDQITKAHISVGLQKFGGSFFRAPATAGCYLGGIINRVSMSSVNCCLRQLGRYDIFIYSSIGVFGFLSVAECGQIVVFPFENWNFSVCFRVASSGMS